MNNIVFWLQPIISAFIGWITTWVAIKMLFHPRKPVKFLGLIIQGVFPKRQRMVAEQLGKVVARELIHFDEIAAQLKDPQQLKDLTPTIEKHLDRFLHVKLKEKLPVISMFVGESTIQKLKDGMLEEIEVLLPEIINQYTTSLSQKVDIEKIVTEKVANYSSDKLEEILQSVMKKEFWFLEIVAIALGFLIGLIQLGIALL
ncbi:MAG: hypothetical protein K0Q79_3525 [Flavipsychrobacter sp.]|jgi:uncharacterized membrane protein YheB (UPF0754 family)|nr:hypothetical protein [Flavipsychrobacter sp.]